MGMERKEGTKASFFNQLLCNRSYVTPLNRCNPRGGRRTPILLRS